MKKYIILIISMLFLSGCDINYNLKVNDKNLTENIKFSIDKNKIENDTNETYMDLSNGLYNASYVNDFLNRDDSAFSSDKSKVYKKKINETSNSYDVNMSYTYSMNQFNDASMLTTCFDSPLIIEDKNYYYIHLLGRFSCLYDDESTVNINITSYNFVLKDNADKQFFNKYTWTIDKNNKYDVDIEFKVAKENFIVYLGLRLIVLAIVIVGIVYLRKAINIWKNRNQLNDI